MAEYITLEELINNLDIQIKEIRQNNNNYQQLKAIVTSLEKDIERAQSQVYDAITVYTMYSRIIAISLTLQNLLKQVEQEEAQQTKIDYAFYYKGTIYYTDSINKNWLSFRNGKLYIALGKSTADLSKEISDTIAEYFQEAFSFHYEQYKKYIEQMYLTQNKHVVDDNYPLNYGNIAEAHEWHLQDMHKQLYNYAKNPKAIPEEEKKSVLNQLKDMLKEKEWHTDADTAWKYIRLARGTQRGTASGDVKYTQVKQIREDYYENGKKIKTTTSMKLTSLKNVLLGFTIYNGIFSLKDSRLVATAIAMYIASFLDNKIAGEINSEYGILNKIVNEELGIDEIPKYILKTNITL